MPVTLRCVGLLCFLTQPIDLNKSVFVVGCCGNILHIKRLTLALTSMLEQCLILSLFTVYEPHLHNIKRHKAPAFSVDFAALQTGAGAVPRRDNPLTFKTAVRRQTSKAARREVHLLTAPPVLITGLYKKAGIKWPPKSSHFQLYAQWSQGEDVISTRRVQTWVKWPLFIYSLRRFKAAAILRL